ncbi:MAG: HepT-like ribonuclease domain-containing protein [Cyanobacteria bacterium P01_G01_bin.19]
MVTSHQTLFPYHFASPISIFCPVQRSKPCQNKYCQMPWRQIIGMRNRIIHAYFDVDLDIIWQVITQDLEPLLIEVEKAIQDLET